MYRIGAIIRPIRRALEPQGGFRLFSQSSLAGARTIGTHRRRHGKSLLRTASPGRPNWRREWFLGVSLGTCLVFFLAGTALDAGLHNPGVLALTFIFLFAVILGSAM